MNGYLNNLAMRSMDLGNRVEPRLPSMFEAGAVNVGPAPKTDAPQAYEEELTVESVAASSRRAAAPESDRVSTGVTPESTRRGEHSTTPQPFAAEDASLVDAAPPVTSPHDHLDSAAVESLTLSVPEETAKVVAQPQSKPATANHPSDASDLSPEIHEERVVEASVPVEHTDSAPPTSQSQTEITIDQLDHTATVFNVQSPKPSRPTIPLAPRTTAPIKPETNQEATPTAGQVEIETYVEESDNTSGLPIDPRVMAARDPALAIPRQVTTTPWRETRSQPAHWRSRQSPGPNEQEPSINVTIGRLEIRAVPAEKSKPNAARRSESPVMPLDEYLRKQRRGAER